MREPRDTHPLMPGVRSIIHTGTQAEWVRTVRGHDGAEHLLVYDGSLRLVSPEGVVAWTHDEAAPAGPIAVLYYGARSG